MSKFIEVTLAVNGEKIFVNRTMISTVRPALSGTGTEISVLGYPSALTLMNDYEDMRIQITEEYDMDHYVDS